MFEWWKCAAKGMRVVKPRALTLSFLLDLSNLSTIARYRLELALRIACQCHLEFLMRGGALARAVLDYWSLEYHRQQASAGLQVWSLERDGT